MVDNYLIKYLRDNASNELSKKYIDYLKIELDWHIYNSDHHISQKYHSKRRKTTKEFLYELIQYQNAVLNFSKYRKDKNLKILSTVYYPIKEDFQKEGYQLFHPVWRPVGRKHIIGDLKMINFHHKVQECIKFAPFYKMIDTDFHLFIEKYKDYLNKTYSSFDFQSLFLFTDQLFYSKLNIDIFKELNKPSFVFSHGLPGIYSKEVDNRSDYLLVWGEKIKENYINAGFSEEKIKIVGNPKYKSISKNNVLRNDFSDILIVPTASVLYHQHEYDHTILMDKSMVILYLYKVRKILLKFGVKKVRYRVHPSLDKQWVHSFLDQDFFICDYQNLSESLNRSSLIIGATSTLFLEALIHGVNYIVYEPKRNTGLSLINMILVPPFDGTDEKVSTAHDDETLEYLLKNKALTDYSLVHDYIQKFDISKIMELIK